MVAECEESGYNKHLPGGRVNIAVKYVKQGVAKHTGNNAYCKQWF